MDGYNDIEITKVAASILSLLGVDYDKSMNAPSDEVLSLGHCDRVFMYNPDAIAEWVYESYRDMFSPIISNCDLNLEMKSVYPPVTPVCFASMYSGLSPEKHGIQRYEKPVLKCRTLFDILAENGKKVAIVSTEGDSISKIFLERDIDYFIYKTKQECNQKAHELIDQNNHNLIVLYNGDYDWAMHRFSPDGKRSIKALGENIETYVEILEHIKKAWRGMRTAVAFSPDHGCHRTYGILGTHGDMCVKDMNIRHFWTFVC